MHRSYKVVHFADLHLDAGFAWSGAFNSQVAEPLSAEEVEPGFERLGTRIANRFRGEQLEAPFEEIRGASIRPSNFR